MKRVHRLARAKPATARAGGPPPAAEEREVRIDSIGVRGDAVAEGSHGPVYVAFALPGELVRAAFMGDRGVVRDILAPSPERIDPACAHFGTCGGCQLQHWDEAAYLTWKRELVTAALAKRGIITEVAPITPAWGAGRRRVGLHAQRSAGGVTFGFVERGGARIVPITQCPAMTPSLASYLPALRKAATALAPSRGEIVLQTLETSAGLDVDVRGSGKDRLRSREGLEQASAVAETADFARLSFEGEVAVERRPPRLDMGGVALKPTPGAFTQPTEAGEAVLAAEVIAAIGNAPRVADLFCGLGTFALRLARRAEVWAVDGDEAMLTALRAAADGSGGALKTVEVARRDLLRAPVAALELKRYDAIVFDPPRSGARLQAEQIGASKASVVAAVSCDVGAFARDARTLLNAGFRLERVAPVDQFRWSAHVEIVGVFRR